MVFIPRPLSEGVDLPTNQIFHRVFDALAMLFSAGKCPGAGSIGEVCAGNFVSLTWQGEAACYDIAASVWRDDFDDVGLVADTARAAGASDVVISHIIHDTLNDETGGRDLGGGRPWMIHILINLPAEGHAPDRASAGVGRPAGGPSAREADQ